MMNERTIRRRAKDKSEGGEKKKKTREKKNAAAEKTAVIATSQGGPEIELAAKSYEWQKEKCSILAAGGGHKPCSKKGRERKDPFPKAVNLSQGWSDKGPKPEAVAQRRRPVRPIGRAFSENPVHFSSVDK